MAKSSEGKRGPHPPERIVVNDRLVLRRPAAEDFEALCKTLNASLGHLKGFMPWATPEGVSMAVQMERLANSLDPGWEYQGTQVFDNPLAFDYLMWNGQETAVIGGGGLMTRAGAPTLEIGIWVAESATRQGVGTAFAKTCIALAFAFPEVAEVLWVSDIANKPSARIPHKLGFTMSEVVPAEPHGEAASGFLQRWILKRSDAEVLGLYVASAG